MDQDLEIKVSAAQLPLAAMVDTEVSPELALGASLGHTLKLMPSQHMVAMGVMHRTPMLPVAAEEEEDMEVGALHTVYPHRGYVNILVRINLWCIASP